MKFPLRFSPFVHKHKVFVFEHYGTPLINREHMAAGELVDGFPEKLVSLCQNNLGSRHSV